jgi:hypothetical protein
VAGHDAVPRRTAIDLVETEQRPPVIERDVRGGGQRHRVREQRKLGVRRVGAGKDPEQAGEGVGVDLGLEDDAPDPVVHFLVDDRVDDRDRIEQ